MDDTLEDEYTELKGLKIPEVSLVDKPAVGDSRFIIFKNEVSKMDDEIIIDDEEELEKAKDEKMEDEEEKDETKKAMNFKDAAKKAAEMLDAASTSDSKEEQKKKMLVGSLKSAAGIKKASDDEEDEDMMKAGRKISKETEATLSNFVSGMQKALDELKSLYSLKAGHKEEEYDYGDKYGKPAKKRLVEEEEYNEVSSEEIDSFFKAVQEGLIKPEELSEIGSMIN